MTTLVVMLLLPGQWTLPIHYQKWCPYFLLTCKRSNYKNPILRMCFLRFFLIPTVLVWLPPKAGQKIHDSALLGKWSQERGMRNRRSETRKGQANARKLCHVGTRYGLSVLRPIRPPDELYEMHFWGKKAGSVSLSISTITHVQRRFAQVLTPCSSELCLLSRVGWLGHPMPQQ